MDGRVTRQMKNRWIVSGGTLSQGTPEQLRLLTPPLYDVFKWYRPTGIPSDGKYIPSVPSV